MKSILSPTFFLILFSFTLLTSCKTVSDNKTADPLISGNDAANTDDTDFTPDSSWELSPQTYFNDTEREVLSRLDDFNQNLILSIARNSNRGFAVSPVSTSIFLSMLANSSEGKTRQEVLDLLGFDNIDELNSLNCKLMHYLPAQGNGALLEINNRIWEADAFEAPQAIRNVLADNYNAMIESVDFGKNTTVNGINAWINETTRGLIPTLLDGSWKQYVDTRALIANTVYFKGDWKSKFDRRDTDRQVFHASGGSIETDMMHQTLRTSYVADDNFELVTLDYKGGRNVLELYLPSQGTDIVDLIQNIDAATNREITWKAKLCDVTLSLPRFTLAGNYELNKVLENLNIGSLNAVDLSPLGIPSLTPMFILQKTNIKVNEEGTELAAATGGVATTAFAPMQYEKVTVVFDRPFYFVVRNGASNTILMAGVVTNP